MPMSAEVDSWLASYDNPMKPMVMAIRDVILAVDPRIEETIKWKAPTFVYKGNMASFFPKSMKHASLMFHKGAAIPGNHPCLEGDAAEGRSLKVASLDDLAKKKACLEAVVRAWIKQQDEA